MKVIKKGLKVLGVILLVFILAALIVPLVVPFPAFPGTVPIDRLKDPDSQFLNVSGIQIHYKQAGSGSKAILLLHGFGASTYSWREVLQPLAQNGTVIAYDRPAFGLTGRPMPGQWTGESPYSLDSQARQLIALLDAKGIRQAILVGNSAGGTTSVYTALHFPERVQALVLVDAAIYGGGGPPQWVKPLLATPQGRWYGPLLVRSIQTSGLQLLKTAWHDPSRTPPEVITGYQKPLQAPDWDRALWELTLAQQPSGLAARLSELKMPVMVVTGDDDRVVPTVQSLRLAQEIQGSQLVVFKDCGHVPQEECPADFLKAVQPFIEGVK